MAIADGFHVDINGNLWLGSDRETFDATTRSEAPFYVYANGNLVANSGTFSGDISGASGTFTGDLSGADISGGSININNNFIVDSSGNLTANNATLNGYLTTTSSINADNITTGTLNVGNINVSGKISFVDNTDVDSSAIVNKLDTGAIPDTKLGNVSASKISAGTLSGMFISGGSVNLGGVFVADNTGMTATGTVVINPTSGNIGNGSTTGSFTSISGSSLGVSGNVSGAKLVDSDGGSSTNIDMSSSFIYMKPANNFELSIGGTTSTFYGNVNPSSDNSKDLGSSSRRWRAIYRLNEYSTSDERLKENIVSLPYGLDFINDLQPKEFNWRALDVGYSCDTCNQVYDTLVDCDTEDCDGTVSLLTTELNDDKVFGFLAQDIEDVLPNTTDYQLLKYNSTDDEYTYSQSNLIAPLVKAVQELSAKNDELESRIAALEA